MRASQVIVLCVLSGAVCGLVGFAIRGDFGADVRIQRVPDTRRDSPALAEVMQRLNELGRSVAKLEATLRQAEHPAVRPSEAPQETRQDETAQQESKAEIDRWREVALVRVGELIAAKETATLQAARAKDVHSYMWQSRSVRNLKATKKEISGSQDPAYLRKMAETE